MEEGLLCLAEQSYHDKRYDAACAVFIHLLRVLPTVDICRRTRITDLLTAALCEWGGEADEQLDRRSSELLMKAYHESLELLPTAAVLSNNLGGLLFRLGYKLESLGYFRRAIATDSLYLKAQDNLDNACSSVVERWHFRMLNDAVRNSAFSRAISRVLNSLTDTTGDLVVLDIGTGSGILSLFAAELLESMSHDPSTASIVGCDMSRVMSRTAVDIVSQSRLSRLIRIVNKKSTELQCPHDLPAKARLVLTETFDSGLLGEHVLSTLDDAWMRLINTHCQSVVIPCGANVYLTAVESDSIRLQNRYVGEVRCVNTDSVQIVCSTNCVHCTVTNHPDDSQHSQASNDNDIATSQAAIGDEPLQTEYSVISDESSRTEYSFVSDEPYTSEKLSRLRSGYKLLSAPSVVVKFNFNDQQEVCVYASGTREISFTVAITRCGRLDGLVLWFDLHLCDDVTVTSSPQGCQSSCDAEQASCWEQAVYPVIHTQQGSLSDVMVCCGDVLNIHCKIGSALRITRCRLSRTDNNKHHRQHLDSCSESPSNKSNNLSNSELRLTDEVAGLLDQQSCSSQGRHLQHCRHHGSCSSDSRSELCTATETDSLHVDHVINSCTKNSQVCHDHNDLMTCSNSMSELQIHASADFLQVDQAINSHAENSQICHGHHGTGELCTTTTNVDGTLPPQSSLLDLVRDDGLADISQHCVKYPDCLDGAQTPQISLPHLSTKKFDWFYLDRAAVGQLNDTVWFDSCITALSEMIKCQHPPQRLIISCQAPIMFPIAALRLGLVSDVCFLDLDPVHRPLIGRLLAANDVGEDHVTFGRPWQRDVTGVLFADIVSPEGCLRQNVFELLNTARSSLSVGSSLSRSLTLLPCQVKVCGLVINSSALLTDSSVLPTQSPTVNHIAPHVNLYRTRCHVDIELSTLDYTPLCDPIELMTFDLDDVIEVKGHRTNVVCVTASQSLPLTAVVYWFELKLSDSVVVSTIDRRTHWTQAAVMFYDELAVETGAEYQLQTIYSDSCISVSVDRLT